MAEMTEREMLELAAKAAGYDIDYEEAYLTFFRRDVVGRPIWNPLHDDGDALRLAVKLKLQVRPNDYDTLVTARLPLRINAAETYGSDCYAASRRAIVRAAAEIGRNM